LAAGGVGGFARWGLAQFEDVSCLPTQRQGGGEKEDNKRKNKFPNGGGMEGSGLGAGYFLSKLSGLFVTSRGGEGHENKNMKRSFPPKGQTPENKNIRLPLIQGGV